MKTIALTMRVDGARERRDALDQNWYAVLAGLGYRIVLIPNYPEVAGGAQAFLTDLGIDGVILTGGNDLEGTPGAKNVAKERDALEGALIEACAARDLPLLGVCRGMQRLVAYYGGELAPVEGHVATMHAIQPTGEGSLPLSDVREVNSYHDFGVPKSGLPDSLIVSATTDGEWVEAVSHESLRQWGILWHPERDPMDARDARLIGALFGQ